MSDDHDAAPARELAIARAQLAHAHRRIKSLADAHRRKLEEVEHTNADLNRFAYVASHDLRAPLRAIDQLASWVEEDLEHATDDVRNNLSLLRQRVRRMDALLMRLLEYSRVGSEGVEIYSVDVGTLLVDTIDLLTVPSDFDITVGDDLPLFDTARGPLERVFLNLVNNAIKHRDVRSRRVTIDCVDRDDMYEFTVEDDGPGIPPQFHQRVTEMFTTLKRRDETEGSGMGLALTRRVVETAGGVFWVESPTTAHGRGTRFHFTWPKVWRSVDGPGRATYPAPMSGYANESALVSTEWVLAHKDDDDVCLVEVDVDTAAYDEGHIPGAMGWNWQSQLCDTLTRDIVPAEALRTLLQESGITNATKVVLYGDNNNWFAAWAYWQLRIFGHRDVALMNGGRKKWMLEGKVMTDDTTHRDATTYELAAPDFTSRAYLEHTKAASENVDGAALVDVRSPDEYTGKLLCPPGLAETCQRGGHIAGARNIPWGQNCNEDGTFKSKAELEALYQPLGVTPEKDVVAYCRIGERSSLTWFVLKELMGYPNVRNYDGSWTEWGNLVGAPIVRGDGVR